MIDNAGVPVVCCGEPMTELIPNSSDGAGEKHVPVVEVDGNRITVKIGSVPHPMVPEHHIEWVYLQTERGGQRKCLSVDSEPVVTFAVTDDDQLIAVYEYCNLHGLWKVDV